MLTETKIGLCESCRELKPVTWTDVVGREYCAGCFSVLPVPTTSRLMDYLMISIPFHVGDVVECRTAGVLYDGIGVIDEVSFDPAKFGTPVYPSFHVTLTEKDYPEAPDSLWYTENCLTKLSTEDEQDTDE